MKKVLIHLVVWVIWYSSTSISAIVSYNKTPWWPTFYNYSTYAAIFYIALFLSKKYLERFSLTIFLRKSRVNKARYILFRREIVFMFILVSVYISVSWYVDRLMHQVGMNPYKFTDFWMYADGKFARCAFYLFVAIGYAIGLAIVRRKSEIIAMKDRQLASKDAALEYEKYDNAFLRKALSERDERVKLIEEYYSRHRQ